MKNYNKLILLSLLVYVLLAVVTMTGFKGQQDKKGHLYKVEVNRILAELEDKKIENKNMEDIADNDFEVENKESEKMTTMSEMLNSIDLSACQEIQSVAYLSAAETDKEAILDFFSGINGKQSMICPFFTPVSPAPEQLEGYLRFDYQSTAPVRHYLFLTEVVLLMMELFLLAVLFYLKYHLIRPFHRMQDMTYELSKGNLQGDVKADKNQYFGKFLWGLSALKDDLRVSRKRELELQKEKKMLLLSLSHDIKTPLNMIKLYAKALGDGIYPTSGEQEKAYHQIGEKAVQIENFVSEIIRASKQDIVRIEVEKGAFYLKDLVQWMEAVYGEKCALRRCAFTVGAYQNRIFQGDFNRLLEVFENLFENALKYGDGRRIQVSFYEEDYCQLIRVFNTGEPVSEKELVHLFDSFFRGENTRGQQGNGLGLYICREIMLKMNGEIFAACEPDGMAFVVVLPVYAGGQKD